MLYHPLSYSEHIILIASHKLKIDNNCFGKKNDRFYLSYNAVKIVKVERYYVLGTIKSNQM